MLSNDHVMEVDIFVTNYDLDPMARRRVMFRLLQLAMLVILGIFFLLAALAQPVFHSTPFGWECLAVIIVAFIGFWWAGRQADRRS